MPTDPKPADNVIAAVEYLQAARHHDSAAQELAVTVHGDEAIRAGLTEIALATASQRYDVDGYLAGLKRYATALRDHFTEGNTP